jgi:hypothetical protein
MFYVIGVTKKLISDNIYISSTTIEVISKVMNNTRDPFIMAYDSEDYPGYTCISFSIPEIRYYVLFYFNKEFYEI